MKKVILGSVLAVAAVASMNVQAAATTVCNGSGTGNVTGSTSSFVKSTFTARCSANVALYGDDGVTYYRVGAVSSKGKNSFGGSSAGGAVTGTSCASSTACVSGDATTALGSAPSS